MGAPPAQQVDLATLSTPQLSSVKLQLDDELAHLTTSFSKLRAAQTKFRECAKSIREGASASVSDRIVLVPLTTSLYVPGRLADSERVIVDVGTGFYVEKSTVDAVTFYNEKVEELGGNLQKLESIVQGKSNSLRIVEDVLRQKVSSSGNTDLPASTA
ncbi:MAG: alpha subunit [Lasallia pustulata]|uniref:Alpha subunit n=1 Tax=Lasallia pustulata TaxID=136370 RepID=A0A5M8PND5_9LECA|nr:MAG: alpha subunit [Lasallia pustulata]